MNLRLSACIVFSLIAFAGQAQAQLIVQGKGNAAKCYNYAINGNTGSRSAIRVCNEAFSDSLINKDKAATFVNRGVLFMRKGDQALASQDFEAALKISPDLAEAHVNYAASLIRQEKYDAALVSINKALIDPNSKVRPEALYNRAFILDQKEDYRGAYRDLKAALVLRPEWEPALRRLERYEVRTAG